MKPSARLAVLAAILATGCATWNGPGTRCVQISGNNLDQYVAVMQGNPPPSGTWCVTKDAWAVLYSGAGPSSYTPSSPRRTLDCTTDGPGSNTMTCRER